MKTSIKAAAIALALSFPALMLHGEQKDDSTLLLSGFEEPIAGQWRSNHETIPAFTAESDPERVKEGTTSGRWDATARSNPWLFLKETPRDWSGYDGLSFWLYAENANHQLINLNVTSGEGYYLHQIRVDWTGWKQIIVALGEFKEPRKTNGWSEVSAFMIALKGWGQEEPSEDTILFFDDLRLIKL